MRNLKKQQIKVKVWIFVTLGGRGIVCGKKTLWNLNSSPGTLRTYLILTVSHPQTFRRCLLYFCFKNADKKKNFFLEKHGVLIMLSQNRLFRIKGCPVPILSQLAEMHKWTFINFMCVSF